MDPYRSYVHPSSLSRVPQGDFHGYLPPEESYYARRLAALRSDIPMNDHIVLIDRYPYHYSLERMVLDAPAGASHPALAGRSALPMEALQEYRFDERKPDGSVLKIEFARFPFPPPAAHDERPVNVHPKTLLKVDGPSEDESNSLYVGGLPTDCTRREVAHLFRPFAGFKDLRVVHKEARHCGNKAYVLCFVEFFDAKCARTAMEALQEYRFDERKADGPVLKIQFARFPFRPPAAHDVRPINVHPKTLLNVDGPSEDEPNTLYVDGLPTDCTRREVAHLFRPFAGFKDIRVVHKEARHSGDKAYVLCFVEFYDAKCAWSAMEAFQEYCFDERKPDGPVLKIQFARFPFRPPSAHDERPINVHPKTLLNVNGPSEDESNTLYVGGLPSDCTRREVAHLFRPFAGFKDIRVVHKEARHSGDKAYVLCFVEFYDAKCARTAMEALQEYRFDERKPDGPVLKIEFARFPFPPLAAHDERPVNVHPKTLLKVDGPSENESNSLYVGGLPTDCTRREVAHLFRPFAGFKDLRVVHKEARHCGDKAYALCFVEFYDAKCALTAMEALQEYRFDERKPDGPVLKIQFARFPFGPPAAQDDRRCISAH